MDTYRGLYQLWQIYCGKSQSMNAESLSINSSNTSDRLIGWGKRHRLELLTSPPGGRTFVKKKNSGSANLSFQWNSIKNHIKSHSVPIQKLPPQRFQITFRQISVPQKPPRVPSRETARDEFAPPGGRNVDRKMEETWVWVKSLGTPINGWWILN